VRQTPPHQKKEDEGCSPPNPKNAFNSVIAFTSHAANSAPVSHYYSPDHGCHAVAQFSLRFTFQKDFSLQIQRDSVLRRPAKRFLRTMAPASKLSPIDLKDEAVESLSSFIGSTARTTLNSGRIQINLKPLAQRKINASDVIRRLQPALAKVDGVSLSSSRSRT